MTIQPRPDIKMIYSPQSGLLRKARQIGRYCADGLGQGNRIGWVIPLKVTGRFATDTALFSNEFGYATAGGIYHRQTTGHGLNHESWAWIIIFGVQKNMMILKKAWCSFLTVRTKKFDLVHYSQMHCQAAHFLQASVLLGMEGETAGDGKPGVRQMYEGLQGSTNSVPVLMTSGEEYP